MNNRFCRQCGTALAEGARFCGGCGTAVETPTTDLVDGNGSVSTPVPQNVPGPQADAPVDPAPTTDSPDSADPAPIPTAQPGPPDDATAPTATLPPAEGSPTSVNPTPRKRRGLVVALSLVAVLVVLGIGSMVAWNLLTRTGAGSPEAAMRAFVDAAEQEDIIGVAKMIPPDEIAPIVDVYKALQGKASEIGIRGSDAPTEGIDVVVDDVDFEVSELADDVAKIQMTGGTWEIRGSVDKIPPAVRQFLGRDEDFKGDGNLTDLPELSQNIMAVRRGGRWYISPAYTAMEVAVQEYNLPAGDFSDEPEDSGGADSAEDAVKSFADAISEASTGSSAGRVIDMIPPDEFQVLRAYRNAIDDWWGRTGSTWVVEDPQLERVRTEPGANGSTKVVIEDAEVNAYNRSESDSSYQISLRGNCARERSGGSNICLDGPIAKSLGLDGLAVSTVQVGKRWYVSPLRTVSSYVTEAAKNGDAATFARAALLPQYAPPDGTVKVGESVQVPGGQRRSFTYALQVDEPMTVAVTRVPESDDYYFSVEFFTKDGESVGFATYDYPVTLAPGEYRMVKGARIDYPGGWSRALGTFYDDQAQKLQITRVTETPVAVPGEAAVDATAKDEFFAFAFDVPDARRLSVFAGTNSLNVAKLGADGKVDPSWSWYRGSPEEFEPGRYRASVRASEPGAVTLRVLDVPANALLAGESADGSITSTRAGTQSVFLQQGEEVYISVSSSGSGYGSSWSPSMTVSDPSGAVISADDGGCCSRSAGTSISAGQTGEYKVSVTSYYSYSYYGSGDYRVSVSDNTGSEGE